MRDHATCAWDAYSTQQVQLPEVQRLIDVALAHPSGRVVLEAGCGSASWFRFPKAAAVVGIDVSPEQLQRNQTLSRKILGDIETYDVSGLDASVVVCCFVLEHLSRPRLAVENLLKGLKPGGVLVVVAPEPWSVVGMATKLLPQAFHVWFYRRVLGNPNAGAPGHPPFPTPMKLAIGMGAVARTIVDNGCEVVRARAFQDHLTWTFASRHRPLGVLLRVLSALSRALSLGRYDALNGTYVIVARRAGAATDRR